MNLFLAAGSLSCVLLFCGIGDRIKQLSGTENTSTNSSPKAGDKRSGTTVEKAVLTTEQQTVVDTAVSTEWPDQGIVWSLPKNWKKTDVKKETALFSSPDAAFLIATVSVMNDDFPQDISLNATYDSAIQQMKNGKYENARMVEIDGIKGVEWTETMPEDKSGPRRHQWIAFRRYLGQNQQLNIMLSTKGTNFEKHRTDFPAIMYSMKISK